MVVGYWFSHFSNQVGRRHGTRATFVGNELTHQTQYLAARATIMADAQKAAAQFDPSSTLNSPDSWPRPNKWRPTPA